MRRHRFEIGLYKAKVRDSMANGEALKEFSEDWADIHYIEVVATTQADARTRIEARYPTAQGFTITDVTEIGEA